MAKKFALTFLILGILLRLIFPEDVSFINDEAKLLNIALKANENGDFVNLGLEGTKGVKYGPLSIYWFRLLLLLTHNIVYISILNTVLVILFTLLGIYLIAKEEKLNFPEISSIAFLSPFLWFYGRNLWDNSLNQFIVLFTLFFYLKFIKTSKFRYLLITSLALNGMFHIHPMSLSICFALIIHFSFSQKEWDKLVLLKLLLMAVFNLAIAYPYLNYLIPNMIRADESSVDRPLRSFTNSFFIAQLFSSFKFSYFLGKGWWFYLNTSLGYFFAALGAVTWTSYLASWRSIVLFFKDRLFGDKLLSLSVIAIVSQAILNFVLNIHGHPHYIAINWFFGLYLVYYSFKNYPRVFFLYRCSLLFVLIFIVVTIHFNNGSRSLHYGPTLGNQLKVARRLNELMPERIYRLAFHPKTFPHTIELIRELESKNKDKTTFNRGIGMEIFYTEGEKSEDAHISVRKRTLQ